MNWIFYGLIFVTVGVVKMIRQHRSGGNHIHRCDKCGTEWQHRTDVEHATARAAVDAHTCPKCGAEQFEIERHGTLPPVPPPPAPKPAPPAPPAAPPPAKGPAQ